MPPPDGSLGTAGAMLMWGNLLTKAKRHRDAWDEFAGRLVRLLEGPEAMELLARLLEPEGYEPDDVLGDPAFWHRGGCLTLARALRSFLGPSARVWAHVLEEDDDEYVTHAFVGCGGVWLDDRGIAWRDRHGPAGGRYPREPRVEQLPDEDCRYMGIPEDTGVEEALASLFRMRLIAPNHPRKRL